MIYPTTDWKYNILLF